MARWVSEGVSALTGTVDINQFNVQNAITSDAALTGSFAASSTGRFTGTLNTGTTGTLNEIFCVVNSSTVLSLEVDTSGTGSGPGTGTLQLQTV